MKKQYDIILLKTFRKLRLNKLIYPILKRIYKHSHFNHNITVTSAIELLKDFSCNDGGTCYCNRTNNKEYDLDIIIPVYNGEDYLTECIESIIKQKTHYKIRLILINDGSTDNTAQILNQYKNHPNISIINQSNTGHSGARNAGLDCLNSKYVMFVDADDLLNESAIEQLLDTAFQENVQIVEGAYATIDIVGQELTLFNHCDGSMNPMNIYGYPWGKVYQSELFEHINFPCNYWYEDSIVRQIIAPQVKTTYGTNTLIYLYRQNPKGISHTAKNSPKCIDSLWITLRLFEDRSHYGISCTQEHYEYYLNLSRLIFQRISSMPVNIRKSVFIIYAEFLSENFNGFTSELLQNKDLELALQNTNYKLYEFCCILC